MDCGFVSATLSVSGLHVDASASAEQQRQLHSACKVETPVSKLIPPGSWRASEASQTTPPGQVIRRQGEQLQSTACALQLNAAETAQARWLP